jgi:Tol biopolymer transport system component
LTFTLGARFGPYEILSALGAGGMGEVYRARDTRLRRDVAIKILPDAFALDPERVARFKREAQVLASLNHPHIAQIYGIEESGTVRAIVMEVVWGRTLAELIAGETLANQVAEKSQALGLPDALAIARQIAEALAAAHEIGIIHRDLKPANIKITDDGTVKVLDFGLAKPTGDDANRGGTNVTDSPTLTSPAATALGLILGTAAYMAPEQAKGQRVDKRADVWAFGCVLYEMLSGRRAFGGDDVSDTLASVLKSDPDWRALPGDLPGPIRLLIERSLVKDRRRRVGDISTALFLLNEAAVLAPASSSTPAAPRRAIGWLVAGAAVGLLAGATLATIGWQTFGRPAAPAVERVSLALPADRAVDFFWFPNQSLAISPDGTEVAYVSANPGAPPERSTQLRVRSLATLTIRDLPETFLAHQPFFSPDGQSVAFFTTNGELKKVALSGGNPVTLVHKIAGSLWTFGVWIASGTIVFGGPGTAGLKQVPADGGSPTALTSIDVAQGETGHYPGSYAPEAGAMVFTTAFGQFRNSRLEAVILQSGERRVITDNASGGGYLSTGHLMFRRGDAVLVAPIDVKRLVLAGPAAALSDDVRRDGLNSEGTVGQVAVSSNGTLAYVPRAEGTARVMGRVGRAGTFTPFGLAAGPNRRPRVSPDGQRVTFESPRSGGEAAYETAVHVHDLLRGTVTRLTETGSESHSVWRPDGKAIAVYARRSEAPGIYLKDLGGQEHLAFRNDDVSASFWPESFSPDGAVLAYTRNQGAQYTIWLLTLGEKPVTRRLTNATASEHSPKLSPDGRWLAYVVDQLERSEVYVRGYPSGEPIAVSASGGASPVWSRDGRTLFYESAQSGERMLMSVPVSVEGSTLKLGAPSRGLSLAPAGGEEYGRSTYWGPEYDVFPDGDFLMLRGPSPGSAREIVLVQHWFEEVRRMMQAR